MLWDFCDKQEKLFFFLLVPKTHWNLFVLFLSTWINCMRVQADIIWPCMCTHMHVTVCVCVCMHACVCTWILCNSVHSVLCTMTNIHICVFVCAINKNKISYIVFIFEALITESAKFHLMLVIPESTAIISWKLEQTSFLDLQYPVSLW